MILSSREAIMTALVNLLAGVFFQGSVNGRTTWTGVYRRLKLWNDVAKADRPVLFVTQHGDTTGYSSASLPAKVTMDVDLFVYIDSSDPNAIPATSLNIILEAVEAAIAPQPGPGGMQTLGGLVQHVRREGKAVMDPGDIDGDGLLLIPLKIFTL